MNEAGAAGLAALANNIAMFQMMKDMDKRWVRLSTYFAVSASLLSEITSEAAHEKRPFLR